MYCYSKFALRYIKKKLFVKVGFRSFVKFATFEKVFRIFKNIRQILQNFFNDLVNFSRFCQIVLKDCKMFPTSLNVRDFAEVENILPNNFFAAVYE